MSFQIHYKLIFPTIHRKNLMIIIFVISKISSENYLLNKSFTSHSGGNLVDGLPPASSLVPRYPGISREKKKEQN